MGAVEKREVRDLLLERYGKRCIISPKCEIEDGASIRRWDSDTYYRKTKLFVHRIIPKRRGGDYNHENCILICEEHHLGHEGVSVREILESRENWDGNENPYWFHPASEEKNE